MNLEYGNGLNTVIRHAFQSDISTKSNFISYLAPKMCLYFHIVYKKSGAVCANFLDYIDSSSQTYMKWPLAVNQILIYTLIQTSNYGSNHGHTGPWTTHL